MELKINKKFKEEIKKKGAMLTQVYVDDNLYVVMAVSRNLHKINTNVKKLFYGVRFLLRDNCIVLVMRIDDDPSNPLYFDHYINPSDPNNSFYIKEIIDKKKFGLAVFDSSGNCVHISAIGVSDEFIAGLKSIYQLLPIKITNEQLRNVVEKIKGDFNPEELWNLKTDSNNASSIDTVNTEKPIQDFLAWYISSIKRLINNLPFHKDLCEGLLMNEGFVEKVVNAMESKYKLCLEDHSYHCQLIAFPLSLPAPSFCVFEVGCADSISQFRDHFIALNFDSYKEYTQGILTCDGKGLASYQMQTGEIVPEEITKEIAEKFFIGHFMLTIKENLLYQTLLWIAEPPLLLYPPELLP